MFRPAFSVIRRVGTLLSQAWQSIRLLPERPRFAQSAESFAHWPLVRIIPPSEPTKKTSGLVGTKPITCWSGCMSSSWKRMPSLAWRASPVMSVQLTPASVDMTTARPFERSAPP